MEDKSAIMGQWCCNCCARVIKRKHPVKDKQGRRYCSYQHRDVFSTYLSLCAKEAREIKRNGGHPHSADHLYVARNFLRDFIEKDRQRKERRALS
jgi:hypothetical protein